MERRKTRGSIYKRGTVFWVQYYRNGKYYRESAKTKKETEAKRLLRMREGEISEGKIPGIHFDKVRFNDLADGFLADYRIERCFAFLPLLTSQGGVFLKLPI